MEPALDVAAVQSGDPSAGFDEYARCDLRAAHARRDEHLDYEPDAPADGDCDGADSANKRADLDGRAPDGDGDHSCVDSRGADGYRNRDDCSDKHSHDHARAAVGNGRRDRDAGANEHSGGSINGVAHEYADADRHGNRHSDHRCDEHSDADGDGCRRTG